MESEGGAPFRSPAVPIGQVTEGPSAPPPPSYCPNKKKKRKKRKGQLKQQISHGEALFRNELVARRCFASPVSTSMGDYSATHVTCILLFFLLPWTQLRRFDAC
jgi:hypothetical protein